MDVEKAKKEFDAAMRALNLAVALFSAFAVTIIIVLCIVSNVN